VHNTNDNHVIIDDRKVQTIGKARNQGSALVGINRRKAEREGAHSHERLVDRGAKQLPKSRASIFVPTLGVEQFALGLGSKDDREDHRPL